MGRAARRVVNVLGKVVKCGRPVIRYGMRSSFDSSLSDRVFPSTRRTAQPQTHSPTLKLNMKTINLLTATILVITLAFLGVGVKADACCDAGGDGGW